MPCTARAVVVPRFGGPEVLELVEREVDEPGSGRVRVAVRAIGVNPIDWKLRRGDLAGMMPVELPVVPGVELAGIVDAVGPGVADLAVGDAIFGKSSGGSYATFALADSAKVARKPAALSWASAAALPVAAVTSYAALASLALRPGETLLIDGGAGGVGTIATQLAHERGIRVIGTASASNHAYLSALGATPVAYGDGLAERVRLLAREGVDAALDVSGRGSLATLVDLVGGPERVVTIADAATEALGVRFIYEEPQEVGGILAEVGARVEAGAMMMPISRELTLDDASEAQRISEAGHLHGKLVLRVAA